VLVFGNDISYTDGPVNGRPTSWAPSAVMNDFFVADIVPPIGLAHRRELLETTGMFNELCVDDTWDLWKRMARSGAEFGVLPLKSGCIHVGADHDASAPRVSRKQSKKLLENWELGKPLFGDPVGPVVPRACRKIAFISPHCVMDFTNGAAVATYAGLRMLARQGFSCEVLCASRMDAWESKPVEAVLSQQGVGFQFRDVELDQYRGQLLLVEPDGFPVSIFKNATTHGDWSPSEAAAFFACCEYLLSRYKPDVVWTYGGDPVSLVIHQIAKRMDIPILFALHNFAYPSADAFRMVDYIVVPAEYSRRYYWEKIGLACQVLPNIVNWDVAYVEQREPRYVTFINPVPYKGLYVFSRIARELARRRPDISFLVTQGRSSDSSLSDPDLRLAPLISHRLLPDGTRMRIAPAVDESTPRNITIMPYTPDPQLFYPRVYSATKILLMPSLWEESFGLVVAEAMLNGIPVLASDRGALPCTLGKSGFAINIPGQYTPDTRIAPTADEVEPWVETIIRLWDDAAFYEQASQEVRRESQRWHPERLAEVYREFFGNLCHQPGPPILP
jgi:glycosyltransferase involved in cell wall biosynthesis